MKAINKIISAVCLTVAISGGVQANLIENGSFEDIGDSVAVGQYGSTSTWQIYQSIPNWDASQNVEIWTNDFIVPAYDGKNVLELNAHPGDVNGSFSIFQTMDTVAGHVYELTFAGRKRQANSDESFSVVVGDLDETVTNQAHGVWNEYSYFFTASSAETTLTFTSLDGGADTTGNIFDDVKVTTAIPEPSALALMMLALTGLFASRKKVNV